MKEKEKQINLSWQARINVLPTHLFCSFFVFFFFWRWKRYFFFDTMDNNITYSRSHRWVPYELSFNKIETKATLETSLGMF